MPDAFLDAIDVSARAEWWQRVVVDPHVTVLVAVHADSLAGFCSLCSSRDDDAPPRACELSLLYVDPTRWRSGYGTALVRAVLTLAHERGFEVMTVWVLASNANARGFYEALGFASDGSFKRHSQLGIPLDEVRYRRNLRPDL